MIFPQEKRLKLVKINQPKGVKPKMREDKLSSDVNWQEALKQTGAHGLSTRVLRFNDTTYNVSGIPSPSFSRHQRKHKFPSFNSAKNNSVI